jgi:hypothetical protein
MYNGWGWRPYVSVAERRLRAMRKMATLRKKEHTVSPVVIEGRTIARTFWGKAWCDNLEQYSDFDFHCRKRGQRQPSYSAAAKTSPRSLDWIWLSTRSPTGSLLIVYRQSQSARIKRLPP